MPSKGERRQEPNGPFIQLGRPEFAFLAVINESFLLLCTLLHTSCAAQGRTCLPKDTRVPGRQDGCAGEQPPPPFYTGDGSWLAGKPKDCTQPGAGWLQYCPPAWPIMSPSAFLVGRQGLQVVTDPQVWPVSPAQETRGCPPAAQSGAGAPAGW